MNCRDQYTNHSFNRWKTGTYRVSEQLDPSDRRDKALRILSSPCPLCSRPPDIYSLRGSKILLCITAFPNHWLKICRKSGNCTSELHSSQRNLRWEWGKPRWTQKPLAGPYFSHSKTRRRILWCCTNLPMGGFLQEKKEKQTEKVPHVFERDSLPMCD